MVAGNESELCLLWNGSQGDDANQSPPPRQPLFLW